MQYKHEYITSELSEILNTFLSYRTDSIFEEYHIIKAIDKCSKSLTPVIIDCYKNMTISQRVNATYFDTDWYIKSHIENNTKIDDTFLTQRPSNHQIHFSFQKMRNDIDMQNIVRDVPYTDEEIENIRKKIFSENLKTDNPVILIQSTFIQWVCDNEKERLRILTSMLSHELRHVVEQYILEVQNTLLSKKNRLNSDFKKNDVFHLDVNSGLYKKLSDIIYCMSAEEQRARIQATWNLCQNVVRDNAFRAQLTASYYQVMSLQMIHQLKNANTNFRIEIICTLRSAPFKYVHQLHMFRRIVNEMFLIKKKENREAMKILGYYLHKHKYISETRNDFSSDDEYILAVLRIVQKNYHRYENIIYNIVGQNIERIFAYKKPDCTLITFDKIVSSDDLGLKDYEVGLINEAYRLYANTIDRKMY